MVRAVTKTISTSVAAYSNGSMQQDPRRFLQDYKEWRKETTLLYAIVSRHLPFHLRGSSSCWKTSHVIMG